MKYFIKQTLVAFYIVGDKYIVQKQILKKNKIIYQEEFKFNEEEFLDFIKSCFLENTQTYISTIIDTFNQGCVDSCSHSRYKEIGIKIENIKILCLKNYSIFIGMYELNQFKKDMKKFQVDFIFSPYLAVTINNKKTKNSLYILYTNSFVTLLIYEDGNKPKYSNLYKFELEVSDDEDILNDEDEIEEIGDDIEEIETLDDIEEIGDEMEDLDNLEEENQNLDVEDLEENINETLSDNNSSENIKNEIINVKNEIDTIDFIKSSIKDYYENYSDNFLENSYILYDGDISDKFIKNIQEETFLEIKKEKINMVDLINTLALKELNV